MIVSVIIIMSGYNCYDGVGNGNDVSGYDGNDGVGNDEDDVSSYDGYDGVGNNDYVNGCDNYYGNGKNVSN